MNDERISKSLGEDKVNRERHDRAATETLEISDASRVEEFLSSFNQNHLPDLPCPPGYRVCWLTTTNPRDSIAGRMRLGYRLMRGADVPGYDTMTMREGQYEGCIMVNEMIAAMLPIDTYNILMKVAHSRRPAEEEERMNAPLEAIKQAARERQMRVAEGDEVDGGW